MNTADSRGVCWHQEIWTEWESGHWTENMRVTEILPNILNDWWGNSSATKFSFTFRIASPHQHPSDIHFYVQNSALVQQYLSCSTYGDIWICPRWHSTPVPHLLLLPRFFISQYGKAKCCQKIKPLWNTVSVVKYSSRFVESVDVFNHPFLQFISGTQQWTSTRKV